MHGASLHKTLLRDEMVRNPVTLSILSETDETLVRLETETSRPRPRPCVAVQKLVVGRLTRITQLCQWWSSCSLWLMPSIAEVVPEWSRLQRVEGIRCETIEQCVKQIGNWRRVDVAVS